MRKAYMNKYLQCAMYIAVCRGDRLKILSKLSLIEDGATIDSLISKANNALFRRIGRHMFTVFNDAKGGTLNAWSWSSRKVAFQQRDYFMPIETIQGFEENPNNFRYLFSGSHWGTLGFIVNADMKQDVVSF